MKLIENDPHALFDAVVNRQCIIDTPMCYKCYNILFIIYYYTTFNVHIKRPRETNNNI